MLYLLAAIACNLAIGMILRHAGRQGLDALAILAVNYAVALAVALGALVLGEPMGRFAVGGGLVLLGVLQGILFIAGFYIFAAAMERVGMALATGVMRLSVAIPFLASWLIWGEVPSGWQGAGLFVAGIAFFLIARQPPASTPPVAARGDQPATPRSAWRGLAALAMLFLVTGGVDVVMKVFDEVYQPTTSPALFLLFVFAVAFLIGFADVLRKGVRQGTWPGRRVYFWGLVLGIVNYPSAAFLLRALEELPGTLAFPLNGVAVTWGGALLGVFIWREHLTRANWLGLVLAAVALVLLNL